MEFQFEREGFFIPVEVHLREDGVEIALMSGEIRETNEKYRLTRVAIAPSTLARRMRRRRGICSSPTGRASSSA